MAAGQLHALIRHLRRLAGPEPDAGLTDHELLGRFVHERDEAAFEVLLWRHGPMVLGACQRLLARLQDVEDVFQATFLVFVRKAGAIRRRGQVGGWLYRVAYRLALRARVRAADRAARERQVLMPAEPAAEATDDSLWHDVRPVLDEEVGRLPERFRLPFVLCHLEGRTNEEAARELGCPVGTILSRLSRARQRLRERLVRRGVTLSAAALATLLTEQSARAALPAVVAESTLKAALRFAAGNAAGAVSPQAAALAEGALRSMFLTKLKLAAVLVMALTGLGVGAGLLRPTALATSPADLPRAAQPGQVDHGDHESLVSVPSDVEGRILFIAAEVAGEQVPAKDLALYFQAEVPYVARRVKPGEQLPPDEKLWKQGDDKNNSSYRRVREGELLEPNKGIVGKEKKWFRKLRAGDQVREGDLLVLVDTSLIYEEVQTCLAKLNGKEAERMASEKTRDEAKERLKALEILRQRQPTAVAPDEYRGAQLTYDRYFFEQIQKMSEVKVAQHELAQTMAKMRLHEIRSPADGTIRDFVKKKGEAVRKLETVLRIEPTQEPSR